MNKGRLKTKMTLKIGFPTEIWLKIFEAEDYLWNGEYKRHIEDLFKNEFSRNVSTDGVDLKVSCVRIKKNMKNSNFYKRDSWGRQITMSSRWTIKDKRIKNEILTMAEFKKGQRIYAFDKKWSKHLDMNLPEHYDFMTRDKWVGERRNVILEHDNENFNNIFRMKVGSCPKCYEEDEYDIVHDCSNWRGIWQRLGFGNFIDTATYAPYESREIYKTSAMCDTCLCLKKHRREDGKFAESSDTCRLCQNMRDTTEPTEDEGGFLVVAHYSQYSTIKCGYDLHKVERDGGEWWVKWNTLYIRLKQGGDVIEIDGDEIGESGGDYKRPDKCEIESPDEWCIDSIPWLLNHTYDERGYMIESDED